jgi:RNA polymerase sigma-70 factor (ECF subfamily)
MACAEIETYELPESPIREWAEQDIVQGILFGHPGCFEELHSRFRGRIYGFALKRLADPAEAEDVTQEVFLQVHRSLASFQGRSTLLTWMFGIAHNQVCRRFRRKSAPSVSLDDAEAIELASEDLLPDRQLELARVLRGCVDAVDTQLSDAQRQVFYLKFAENRSTKSIARHLGKSNQAVKISLFRSRKTLTQSTPNLEAVLSA